MVDYSYLSEGLLSAVRSLDGYQEYARFLKSTVVGFDEIYRNKKLLNRYVSLFDISSRRQFELIIAKFGEWSFFQACKAVHNAYMKTTRVKKRLQYILDVYGQMYFLTFTINDDYYDKYSNDVSLLCKYCSFILKQVSTVYVFNTDYGDKNGRLHIHACVSSDLGDVQTYNDLWTLGFVKVIPVIDNDNGQRRLARYLTKLARHAVKQSAFKVVYSRLNKKRS